MALEYLADLGGSVKPGDKIANALNARRVNALIDGVRATTRGDNLTAGPGILLKKSPGGVIISAVQTARGGSAQPRMVALEIALDADTAPTSAQIDAALVAFYVEGTAPREGDTFRISRADNSHPEVEVQLTATALGPDWRFSPDGAVTILEKPWYRVVRDISGRSYFEGAASKATVDEAGVTVRNVSGSKTLTVPPASITADMTIRDLPVIVGNEVKLARVIASAPVSQSPVVNIPGMQEYLEGGGIRFLDSETDAKYITVYLPEIADEEDQDAATLIKLEYVPATLPGGAEGVRLKYSSRITDNTESKVRLFTEDSGETWFFDLSAATHALLANLVSGLATANDNIASLAEEVGILNATQDEMMTTMLEMATVLDEVVPAVELNTENIDVLFAHVDFIGTRSDEHEAAISGATISCDSSGVTLTWGTPPPPPGP